MGKLILSMMVTLDGFTAGPGGELDWSEIGEKDGELLGHMADVLRGIDAMIFGRVTYEMLSGYWPAALREASTSGGPTELAQLMNTVPKIVISKGSPALDWAPAKLVSQDIPAEISRLKADARQDIALFAGARTAATFLEHDLIDEYRLMIYPVLLGAGQPLFTPVGQHRRLRLVDVKTFERSGVAVLRYRRPSLNS